MSRLWQLTFLIIAGHWPSSVWWVLLLEVPKGVQEYVHFCLRKLGRKMLHFPETVWVKLLALETSWGESHPVCITQVSLSFQGWKRNLKS